MGIATGYIGQILLKKRLTWGIGAFFGFSIFAVLANMMEFNSHVFGFLFCCMGGIAGGYLGRKLDKILKSVCTAFLGAVILTNGISDLIPALQAGGRI